ncbi:hypothetical protein RF11_09743 [Thelohanellus kitauei]|uniref:Uncharacterized protein n=1 Tax=Thelohanellus kitauei TaxID=669202 RepID=A0A0C2IN90_THEKT|nr:hypothetical protein RF11_09743 [Thelohanellus kitauei]
MVWGKTRLRALCELISKSSIIVAGERPGFRLLIAVKNEVYMDSDLVGSNPYTVGITYQQSLDLKSSKLLFVENISILFSSGPLSYCKNCSPLWLSDYSKECLHPHASVEQDESLKEVLAMLRQ